MRSLFSHHFSDIRAIRESGFLALVFTLPLYRGFFGVMTGVVLLFSLLNILKEKRFPDFRIHWFLPALFCYYLLSGLLTHESWSELEKRLPLLFIPVLFALNNEFFRPQLRNKVFITFILGNMLAVILCLMRAVVRSIHVTDGQWGFNSKAVQDTSFDFFTSAVMGGNYFFGDEFSYFLAQPTYFGIYIVFCQALIFHLFQQYQSRRERIWLILCYLIFGIILFLLSSKAAIFTSFLFTLYVLYKLKLRWIIKIAIIGGFAIFSVILLVVNPRTKLFVETFVNSTKTIDPQAKYGHKLRILSWDAALEVIRDHWLFGVGEGKKEYELVSMYVKKGYTYPAERLYNSHNQYLDFLLGGGVFCLLLFIAGCFDLFMRSVRHSNFLLSVFMLIIGFNLFFENLLSRHAGIVLFSVFTCFLMGKLTGYRIDTYAKHQEAKP